MQELKRNLTRRLLPLYVAAFFQGFVLWYAIEKLFMQSIGFNNTTIGLMIAVYSAVMLAVSTPSGMLADRWSRKWVLIVAGISLALSGLVGGLSHNLPTYLACAVLWGIFFACYSGLYDTIVYDTIAEVTDNSRLFDSLYGRVQFMDSAGLALGALLGGTIASIWGLRMAYFVSVPLALLSIVALMKFREPMLHKKQAALALKAQLLTTWRAAFRQPSLIPVVVVMVLQAALMYSLFEFSQLWLLALHTPTVYYGIANAILLCSIGAAGIATDRLRLSRYAPSVVLLILLLAGLAGLIVSRNLIAVVLEQFIVGVGLICFSIIFNRLLHDGLGPSIRASASSAVGTVGRLLIIPLALIFGYASTRFSVYVAAYILLALAVVMAVFVVLVAQRNGRTGLESQESNS